MKKIISALLVSTILLTPIFASGQGEAESGPLELSYANFSTEGEAHYPQVTESIKQYNSDNEGKVFISDDKLPGAAYTTNIQAIAASNDLPNIAMVRASQAKEYGQTGIVIPLNDLMDEYGLTQRLKPGVLKESSDGDVCYGIPWVVGYYGFIMYNQEIFDEVGIDHFPKDLDEFKVACDKLLAAGYIPMALGDKPLWPADSLLFSSFVNKFVGTEWTDNIVLQNGKSNFMDPEFIAALTAFQKLAKDGTFNENFTSLDANDARILYSQGKAAMTSTGDWQCKLVYEESPEVGANTKIACWPGPKTGAKAGDSMENSSAWSIALSSNNTDAENRAAMDYLCNYQLTPEWGEKKMENGGSISSYEHEVPDNVNPILAAVYDYDFEPCLNWDAVLAPSVREIFQRGLQSLLSLSITPEELAQKMQAEQDSL